MITITQSRKVFKTNFKYLLLNALIIISGWSLNAQELPREISVHVVLEPMLQLNVLPKLELEFGILEINDDLYHVTKRPEDVMFSVESTTNWNLSISTDNPYFVNEEKPDHKIPVDFIGYNIENMGTNWDNGSFSNIINMTKDTVLELAPERRTVLKNGRRNNMGSADMNSFIIHWKMMFENDALKMKSYAHYFLADERFKVNIQLTLSETLCTNCE